ncbi:MAG: OmpA family protein, partial [Proteobacteria bacterium]|nr:OmpA family protein [Pseudomonadota bacterium]
AEDEDALVVNFFDPPQRAGISASVDSRTAREALRLAPYSMGTDSREKFLAEGVDRSAGEALRLRGLASNNRDASRLKVVIAEVFFPLDEDRLVEEARILLDNVARHLNQHPELSIEVRGYANDIGDESWNANLAGKRAQRVVEYIVRQKTSSWRLEARDSDEYLAPIRPGEDPRSGRKAEIVLVTH